MKDASCMYCAENEKLQSLMLPIAELPTGKLYLFKTPGDLPCAYHECDCPYLCPSFDG